METHIGKGIGKYIEKEIFSVTTELKIATPAISLDFCKKIIELIRNGIHVKIITSNSKATDSEEANQLLNQFFLDNKEYQSFFEYKVVSAKEVALIHAKIYVIDKKCAIIGSANFTINSFNNFAEYIMMFREIIDIEKIDNDFEILWNMFSHSKIEMPSMKKNMKDTIRKLKRKI